MRMLVQRLEVVLQAILLNGAGRAAANAPERLRSAEEKARSAGRGVWGR